MHRVRVGILILVLLGGLVGCNASRTTPTPFHVRLPTPTPVVLPTITWTPRPTPTLAASPPRVAPTISPTPTPTPKPLPYGWVRPLQARLREGPSTEARTIALVPGGTTVQLLGRSADRPWYRVRVLYPDKPPQEGWMAQSVIVTFVSADEIPTD